LIVLISLPAGDEMFSDIYKIKESANGLCYEVEGKFYTGESMNPEGMVGFLDYREDGITPYILFFKDGLELEKCVSFKTFY
ncbi:UNVERIFIED_CONTAM: hypothetical protein FKN15_064080, partial [Acipenser sinensis]